MRLSVVPDVRQPQTLTSEAYRFSVLPISNPHASCCLSRSAHARHFRVFRPADAVRLLPTSGLDLPLSSHRRPHILNFSVGHK
jgi:hypothetical protein